MRGQLYCRHANATALSSSPVVSALGSELDHLGSSPGWGKALCPWDMRKKKCELHLAKSIYYLRKFLTTVIYEDCIGLSNPYQWVLYQILLLDVIISVGANRRDTGDSFFYLVFVTKWLHFRSYPEPVAGIPYKNRKEIITQILNLKLSNTCHVANGISHSRNMT